MQVHNLRHEFNRDLFDRFVSAYNRTFTDPSEREDPSLWEARLSVDLPSPQPKINILTASIDGRIAGGIVIEFYRQSFCGLVSYILVDPEHRRKGIASSLIAQAKIALHEDAQSCGGRLEALFAEVEDPGLVTESYFDPKARLGFFHRLGAEIIDIPYVQPELMEGRGRCRHLLLLSFPIRDQKAPDKSVLELFLREFYLALGVACPEKDPDFTKMIDSLDGGVRYINPELTEDG